MAYRRISMVTFKNKCKETDTFFKKFDRFKRTSLQGIMDQIILYNRRVRENAVPADEVNAMVQLIARLPNDKWAKYKDASLNWLIEQILINPVKEQLDYLLDERNVETEEYAGSDGMLAAIMGAFRAREDRIKKGEEKETPQQKWRREGRELYQNVDTPIRCDQCSRLVYHILTEVNRIPGIKCVEVARQGFNAHWYIVVNRSPNSPRSIRTLEAQGRDGSVGYYHRYGGRTCFIVDLWGATYVEDESIVWFPARQMVSMNAREVRLFYRTLLG